MRGHKIVIACLAAMLATSAGAGPEGGASQEIYFGKPQYLERSEDALLAGDNARAETILRRALRHGIGDRDRFTVYNNLCVAQFLQDKLDAALAHCQKAIKARSNRWRAYNNLGNVLSQLGRYEDAIAAYENGLELASKSRTLRRNLDLVQRRLQRARPGS